MYCPRCGRQPIAEELRFCSYCGFKLGVVKAALADNEEVAAVSDARNVLRPPRNRDISIGVILMFAGALLAALIARMDGRDGREAGAIALTIFYSLTILFSGPITKGIFKLFSWDEERGNLSAAKKEMCFGSTLMFLSTLVSAIISLVIYGRMRTEPFFMGLTLAFAFLLVISRFLMKGLQSFVTVESTGSVSQPARGADQIAEPSLSSLLLQVGHDEPIPAFGAQRVQTAEIVSPVSITEHTTNLLDKK